MPRPYARCVGDTTPGDTTPRADSVAESTVPGDGASAERTSTPPERRRTVLRIAAVVAICVIVYALVVTLYAASGAVRSPNPKEPKPPTGGVTVVLSVESVDAAAQRSDVSVQIDPSEKLYSGNEFALRHDVHVIVSPIDGEQTLDFPAHSAQTTKPVRIFTDGEIGTWPFDSYHADELIVVAYTKSDGVAHPIPAKVWFTGDVPGWRVDVSLKGEVPHAVPSTLVGAVASAPTIDFRATRSSSTVAFAFVLLALLVVMPSLVLFVAITAFRGKRKLEPSFMGWMGAMLFATIPLRTFLPGSPPIGSWIDFTVVLWVVVGLVTGLAVYVAAWARWSLPEAKK